MKEALLTDLYQLTMGEMYLTQGKNDQSTFDLFMRGMPKDWGYLVAAGIDEAVDTVTNLRFEDSDINFLNDQQLFRSDFLNYLREFKFRGDIKAMPEGTVFFPNEPIMRITGRRIEAQFLETVLLNTVNFQTLIASKSSRIVQAAQGRPVMEFGLRRAQGQDAAMKGARASYIAGFASTSNVLAGREYGIPLSGTMAHSAVTSFPSELEAFRAYAEIYPDNTTLLIDTYDIRNGIGNAITVGQELATHGHQLRAVRIDSGELASEAVHARVRLKVAGLDYVKIIVSNDLNEFKINQLLERGAPIDGFGVGTENIVGKPAAALSGVYKLVADEDGPKMKLSSGKKSYPGVKQVWRKLRDGLLDYDVMGLETDQLDGDPLLVSFVENGQRVRLVDSLEQIRQRVQQGRNTLPGVLTRLQEPWMYSVEESQSLRELIKETRNKLEV